MLALDGILQDVRSRLTPLRIERLLADLCASDSNNWTIAAKYNISTMRVKLLRMNLGSLYLFLQAVKRNAKRQQSRLQLVFFRKATAA